MTRDPDPIDQLIAEYGGDLRAAVVALATENHRLMDEVDRLAGKISEGFVRGRVRRAKG